MLPISNLERARRAQGLTQVELARLLGVQQSTISQIEQRKRNPSVSLLIRAAAALQTTVDDLLGGDDGAVFDNSAGGGNARGARKHGAQDAPATGGG